jgi:hypothetical protein
VGDPSGGGVSKWIDGAAKVTTAVAIPVIGFIVDGHLKAQTAALEQQKQVFEQVMTTRERNINLSLKFYEVIGSKRFECYDESKGPLLKIFLDTNNMYNDLKIPYEDVASSLTKTSLSDPSCTKVAEDAEVAKRSNNGDVPVVVASAAPEAEQKNVRTRAAIAKVAKELHAKAAHPEEGAGDGWVAVGRHHEHVDAKGHRSAKSDFSNFAVVKAQPGPPASLQPGTIIKTKTAVYLRYSADDTGLGRNHILAVLSRGTCVTVERTIPDLRSQTWARVGVQLSCPADEDPNHRASVETGNG